VSLNRAPLLYVFFETASLPRQREFYEGVLGLPVIENQFHPPHEYHGLVKYDAGRMIVSLNLSKERRFQNYASDGLITALNVDSPSDLLERLRQSGDMLPSETQQVYTDEYGHHYIFQSNTPEGGTANNSRSPTVRELILMVNDLHASLTFYRDILGLELLEQTEDRARFATGTVDLTLQPKMTAPDGRLVRYNTYLVVFYTPNIQTATDVLTQRGLHFTGTHVGYSDIGGTIRFIDPSGHVFCLYEPSQESLTWGSGPKVKEIVSSVVQPA
jgi:catechol 2,3-dioxygenase-like lactoylglutathione lyase family enzyme